MRRLFFLLAVIGAIRAFSAPLYFTFTGKINFIPEDKGGYAAAHAIQTGNTVTYIFAVDTARLGFEKSRGEKTDKPDSLDTSIGYHADYFFDSLIAPSLFSPAVADSASGSYFGYHITSMLGATVRNSAAFQTIIGDADHETQIVVYITDTSSTDFLPKLGAAVSVTEAYVDSSAASSSASMSMTLTAISATRPSIGIRNRAPLPQAWLRADIRGGVLSLQNGSGHEVAAEILDASGRTALALRLGNKASLPIADLPRGLFCLKILEGQDESVLRAFPH